MHAPCSFLREVLAFLIMGAWLHVWAQAGPLAEYWASQGSWALVFYLLSGGVIAMLYNLVHYRMIQARMACWQSHHVCLIDTGCFISMRGASA